MTPVIWSAFGVLILIALLDSRKELGKEVSRLAPHFIPLFWNVLIFLALVSLIIMGYKAL
jgi:hypothetical protein